LPSIPHLVRNIRFDDFEMLPILGLATLALLPSSWCQGTSSSKRGLIYIPSNKHPSDASIWDSGSSDLTWYYNYGSKPSPAFDNSAKLQFVPMLWGAPADTSDNTFLNDVQTQIQSGAKIPYVLGFNEPDGSSNGGSNVPADTAAQTWIREIEPLRKQGVKLGAPAVTGAPSGFTWLQNFFSACNGNCTPDFLPVHFYGNFQGLASHVGQVRGTYPNMTVWVTEYADPEASYAESQSFYNQSSQFFDRIELVYCNSSAGWSSANKIFLQAISHITPISDLSAAMLRTLVLTRRC